MLSVSKQRTSQRTSQRSSFMLPLPTMRSMWSRGNSGLESYEDMGPAMLAVRTAASGFRAEEVELGQMPAACVDICKSGPAAILLLVFALFQGLLTYGLVYGFPSMVPMLQDAGVYAHLCPESSAGVTCTERSMALTWVFSLGSAMNAGGALLAGILIDVLGTKAGVLLALLSDAAGSLLLGLSPATSDVAWPVAFVLYGFAACCITLSNLSLANG